MIGVGGSGYCGTAPRWIYTVLLLVPIVAGIGGIVSLVSARRGASLDAALRKGLRTLGIIAIVFAFLVGILNLVASFIQNFCLP